MNRYEKSLQTLELPAVLELLAAEADSESAKAACHAIAPTDSAYEVRRRQGETSAAKAMMVLRGAPAFRGAKDMRGALARADLGGVLNTRELLDIAALLRCPETMTRLSENCRRGDYANTCQAEKLLQLL